VNTIEPYVCGHSVSLKFFDHLFIKLLPIVINHVRVDVEGAVMADLAEQLLGVKECGFRPRHVNNLANEFRCYANYCTSLTDRSDNTDGSIP